MARALVGLAMLCICGAASVRTSRPFLRRRTLLYTVATAAAVAPLSAGADEPSTSSEMAPAVVILRVAEVTEYQERILRRAAELSPMQRESEGLVIGRQQLSLSTDILLRNTKLGSLPGCAAPALTLGGIRQIAQRNEGTLSPAELVLAANLYARARSELRVAFESMPVEEQRAGKEIVRQLRAADEERIRQAMEEDDEELRLRGDGQSRASTVKPVESAPIGLRTRSDLQKALYQ